MIHDEDPLALAVEIGGKAAGSLARHHLAPTPSAYAVLYAYHAGNVDIVGQVDGLLPKGLTNEDCSRLYHQFLCVETERATLEKAAETLISSMEKSLEMLREAGANGERFGESLNIARKGIGSGKIDVVKRAMEALTMETASMANRNKDLQNRLSASTKEVGTMRANLETARAASLTDQLTGIPNRRSFDSFLRNQTAMTAAEEKPLCLIICDIDHFKKFNDTHGHPVGDQVLKSVARILSSGVREGDLVARFGGEEFVIVMPSATLEEAARTAERLRAAVASRKIIMRGAAKDLGSVTMSFGIAQHFVGEPTAGLLERADKALYAAKEAGRNSVMRAAA